MAKITSENAIGRVLMDVREGDEIKIRTDEGYYLTKEITHIQGDVVGHDRELIVGPEDGVHLLIYVDEIGESIGDLKNYKSVALGLSDYGYEQRGEITELHDLRNV